MPHSWIRRINIFKTTILPKAVYKYNAISIKLPMAIFHRTRTKFLNVVWKHERPQIAKAILRKKKELEESSSLTSNCTTKLQ